MRIQFSIYGERTGLALEELYMSDLVEFTDTADMTAKVMLDFMKNFDLCQNCRKNYHLTSDEQIMCHECAKLIPE